MKEGKVRLESDELDNILDDESQCDIKKLETLYSESLELFKEYDESHSKELEDKLVLNHLDIAVHIKYAIKKHPRIHVFPFDKNETEASRIIAKLRDPLTSNNEFLYYIQRAYELMFSYVFLDNAKNKERVLIQRTPVDIPSVNYGVHRLPEIDDIAHETVICTMLRGALLPSMIISKEFQDYSSDSHITPFALFRIKRNEERNERDMEYVLDLDKSFFDKDFLNGKVLVFADPMNATGGSLITIAKYLDKIGIKPKRIICINVISALKGALRITGELDNAEVYTLWMDPILNEKAYILPGLGDAGDRLNGKDESGKERNMIQLIADYGKNINDLYRSQVREIEKTVLG